jgi:hypothetical protein
VWCCVAYHFWSHDVSSHNSPHDQQGLSRQMTGFPQPGALLEGLRANSVPETGSVQREVAVAIAGRESSSETQTLGLVCDWRLTKR